MKASRPKSVESPRTFMLNYLILTSGECVIGVEGPSFGAFIDARGAAEFLRRFADAIERDAEERSS